MDFDHQAFIDHLTEQGHLARAASPAIPNDGGIAGPLISAGLIGEETLARALAAWLDLPLKRPEDMPARPVPNVALTIAFMRNHRVLPLQVQESRLHLAMTDPTDAYVCRAVEMATGLTVVPAVAVPMELEQALSRLFDGDVTDVPASSQTGSEAEALLTGLVERASSARSSDIHLEPFEGQVKVRLRIDGRLSDTDILARDVFDRLLGRIKVVARLDIGEKRKPQDGRFTANVRGHRIDMRVSLLPTAFGESVVLRLLDRQAASLSLEALGFSDAAFSGLNNLLSARSGLVLVTGPTGSGKTTTLYAGLSGLNDGTSKIVSVEDPVEYDLPGINQVQVEPAIGLDFASVLRSTLRHDPDIIMVGEIRDRETAAIAVQAALTGHFVLATVHADTATGTIPRLVEMGIEPFLLASTLRGVVNQRLIPALCSACRRESTGAVQMVHGMNIDLPATRWAAGGCDACRGTGRAGRIPIAEILSSQGELADLIRSGADSAALKAAVRRAGASTLMDDGLVHVAAGSVALEDVVAVASI